VTASAPLYDTIGIGYRTFRRPDPRIAAQIWAAVGDAERILNVGAGTGSYEQGGRRLVAVEPSAVMAQGRDGAVPLVRAVAEDLPFPDDSFDVALALMTVHHWRDIRGGLGELCRVASRQVIFTFDPALHDSLWVFTEYVPAARGLADHAPVDVVTDSLDVSRVEIVPVPADCTDGSATAYWRRPEQYLLPVARSNISAFARLDQGLIAPGMAQLERDLASGVWQERHSDLLTMDQIDAGLRLVIGGTTDVSGAGAGSAVGPTPGRPP
jgi:SAM-dependent methyltransferase